ncbi:ABC transporter related protein, partial [human gut metagenome]
MSYAQAAEVTGKTVNRSPTWCIAEKRACEGCWNGRGSQMRSHEERVAETKRRIAKIEREKRLRRNTIPWLPPWRRALYCSSARPFAMPGIAANIQTGDYSGFETAA